MESGAINKIIMENIPLEVREKGLDKYKVIIFGAGGDGLRTLSMLHKFNIKDIIFCDNDSNKWGKKIGTENEVCISPLEIENYRDAIFVIGTRNYTMEIKKQLEDLKVEFITSDAYLLYKNIDKINYVYENLLNDSDSKRTYFRLIEIMVTGNFDLISSIYSENQYFAIPPFALHKTNDIFIDCGASVGDTLEQFIYKRLGLFNKIFAFEPCIRPYKAMEIRRDRLVKEWGLDVESIKCINEGLADYNGTAYLDTTGLLGENFIKIEQENDTSDEIIKITTLDTFFEDFTEKITFLKADIEGYELKMLQGAKKLIKKDKPKLAICIYHNFDDIFEIPLYIKSLVPEYKMEIRHHQFNLWETVLYCYV